jgi:hypothetical protein
MLTFMLRLLMPFTPLGTRTTICVLDESMNALVVTPSKLTEIIFRKLFPVMTTRSFMVPEFGVMEVIAGFPIAVKLF